MLKYRIRVGSPPAAWSVPSLTVGQRDERWPRLAGLSDGAIIEVEVSNLVELLGMVGYEFHGEAMPAALVDPVPDELLLPAYQHRMAIYFDLQPFPVTLPAGGCALGDAAERYMSAAPEWMRSTVPDRPVLLSRLQEVTPWSRDFDRISRLAGDYPDRFVTRLGVAPAELREWYGVKIREPIRHRLYPLHLLISHLRGRELSAWGAGDAPDDAEVPRREWRGGDQAMVDFKRGEISVGKTPRWVDLRISVPSPPKEPRTYTDEEVCAERDAILANPPGGARPDFNRLVKLIVTALPGIKHAQVKPLVTGHTGRARGRPSLGT